MSTKITYVHADHFDLGTTDCGFDQQRNYIIVGDGYTFGDWLADRGVRFNQDSDDQNTYFLLDDDLSTETCTGEAYMILKSEPTEEELQG
ncbi:hypothetical protein [Caproicibacter fermentans]|uniref:Uncharacterized protein n=1 Tax=Caproicibacter fermentans TaxID=2576756 RepID=A0A7G8TD68_9FIRM|nr:hypothetical protein [Caproicibacter fermentans]QNK41559.1 hypothetical protein HCR03_04660 [Caproicibacter fermentans]